MRTVTVLGATGSVGRQTLELVAQERDGFEVAALTAQSRVDDLIALALAHRPKLAVIGDERLYGALKSGLAGSGIESAAGAGAITAAAERPADWVMAAIVGAAGLAPTLAAARRGATVALANKEALVCAGPLFTDAVARSGATLLPVDSEHNAIFQSLAGQDRDGVVRLILTASGGPFRGWTRDAMAQATPEQAVAHPNWSMGAKISVDSASLMNKGLELIEAAHLFDMPEDRISVLIHPQSVVHSLVEYSDGSLLAQLGTPDMRTPIAHCLAWPKRMRTPGPRLDLVARSPLTFEPPDEARFPLLRMAREALQCGGARPTMVNAANEVAVAAFLNREISFLGIECVIAETIEKLPAMALTDLSAVAAADAEARRVAGQQVTRLRKAA